MLGDNPAAGKGPSKDWVFFTSYNTEQAYEKLEINASKADKDFIAADEKTQNETITKMIKDEGKNEPSNLELSGRRLAVQTYCQTVGTPALKLTCSPSNSSYRLLPSRCGPGSTSLQPTIAAL